MNRPADEIGDPAADPRRDRAASTGPASSARSSAPVDAPPTAATRVVRPARLDWDSTSLVGVAFVVATMTGLVAVAGFVTIILIVCDVI